MDTIELCRKLKELGWTGSENPEEYAVNNPYGNGAWVQWGVIGDWIPNPGRQQLHDEVLKLIGEERMKELLKNNKELPKKAFSHEDWMRLWIKFKTENK